MLVLALPLVEKLSPLVVLDVAVGPVSLVLVSLLIDVARGGVEVGSVLAPVASARGGRSGGKPRQLAKSRGSMSAWRGITVVGPSDRKWIGVGP